MASFGVSVGASTGVSVRELPAATRFCFRGDDIAADAVGRVLGVALPREACRAKAAGNRAALWLGPDEWLILGPDGQATSLTAAIESGLGGRSASLVTISDRQLGFEVEGPQVEDVLNAFIALDLSVDAFPPGMCTRTVFGKAEIVLWRTGPETFRIEVWRSFAPYVLGSLDEARREFGEG